ncbi:MAG: hypothetical protein ACTHYF_04870, partial [Ruoffia tabacinasalis]
MKKSLLKLTVVSAAALTLSTVAAPAVDAYYQDNNGTEYQTLVNVSNADFYRLLDEITTKIVALEGQIGVESRPGVAATGKIAEVEAAEAALATARKNAEDAAAAYADAVANNDAAIAEKKAADLAVTEAQKAVDALTESYGEYTRKVAAAEQLNDEEVDNAEYAYANAVAEAEGSAQAAINAYDAAVTAQAEAAALVNAEDFATLPEDTQAQLREALAVAESALTTATNERNAAVTTRDNAISTAATTRDAAISASNAKLTTTLADLEQEYVNNNAYGEYATIEEAEQALLDAQSRAAAAATAVEETQAALADAQAANTTAQTALRQAQIALASAQAALENLFSEKAYLDVNLHELVVGQQATNDYPSLENLTDEQQNLVEEITGKSSEELEAAAEEAAKKAEEAKKHAEELRGENEDDDANPVDPEESDDESESDDETESDDESESDDETESDDES